MTLFRGYGGDLPLMRWLEEKIWPVEARLDEEDVYWGTRLACVEMIRTGTTPLLGHVLAPGARPRGRSATPGLRAAIGGPLFELGTDTEEAEAKALDNLEAQEELVAARSRAGALPRTRSTSVGEELLRWTAETAAERDLPVQIHLSETEKEVSDCVAAHGVRPAALPRPARPARRAHAARPRRLARPRRSSS